MSQCVSLHFHSPVQLTVGGQQIFGITLGCYMLRRMPNSRAYLAILFFLPSVMSAILLMTLPFSNRTGLLSAFYVMSAFGFSRPCFAFPRRTIHFP